MAITNGDLPNGDREPVVFSFEKLDLYATARAFRKRVYGLMRLLPSEERYCLRLQMRRAVLSLTNAISEGHGRYSYKDMKHYCYEARGSLQEIVDDINDCMDRGYARADHLDDLRHDAFRVLQLVDGWARYLERQHQEKLKKTQKNRGNVS